MDEPAQERANILIVDDRPDKHVVFRAILEDLGQNLISVSSREEALRQVLQRDCRHSARRQHARARRAETAALIRGRQQSAHVPIIFITADYGDEVRTAKASSAAGDFMASPVIPEILWTKVKVFVDLYLLAQQSRRQAESVHWRTNALRAPPQSGRASDPPFWLGQASASGSLY
jgi:CheY-like chemotaxis protein